MSLGRVSEKNTLRREKLHQKLHMSHKQTVHMLYNILEWLLESLNFCMIHIYYLWSFLRYINTTETHSSFFFSKLNIRLHES